MPLMEPTLTREQYGFMLQRLYCLVCSWEQWAQIHAPSDLWGTVVGRQRAHLLASDLRYLELPINAEVREFPAAKILGFLSTGPSFRAGFLGAMYVMEGSTLGGQYIARHVEKVLGLMAGEGDAYFRGHAERTGELWLAFKGLLADLPETQSDGVIAAARAMFGIFREGLLS